MPRPAGQSSRTFCNCRSGADERTTHFESIDGRACSIHSSTCIPLVPGSPLPAELDLLTRPLIVGLTKDPDRLVQIRRNRLKLLNQGEGSSYADPELVRAEVQEARRLFSRRGWPVIDVSRRSIEETAAAILNLLSERRRHTVA